MFIVSRRGGSRTLALALILMTTLSSMMFFPDLLETCLEEGIELITKEEIQINQNISWETFKASGMKITEQSWNGFFQLCKRLKATFGALTVYLDIEVRAMWVYGKPASGETPEAYYIQFSK